MKETDLKPLKLYDFGPLKLPGAHNPRPYLDDCYGPDWDHVVNQIYDHKTKEPRNMIKVALTHFEPAVPDTWP